MNLEMKKLSDRRDVTFETAFLIIKFLLNFQYKQSYIKKYLGA